MKTQNRTRKINKPVLAIVAILLLGLVAASAYAFVLKPQNDTSTDTAKSENKSSDEQQPETIETTPEDKVTTPNTDTPSTPTTNSGSTKQQVQMVASVDQSNGSVYIRGGVNYPVSGGSCFAQLSGPSNKSIRKESSVLPNPASTDCKTIIIPASELSSGKWTFTLNYTSDEYEGVSSEVSFTL